MKKYLVLCLCMLVVGCLSDGEKKQTSPTSNKVDNTSEETLKAMHELDHAGNEKGFYHIIDRENEEGDAIKNIMYVDYGTLQEIYLCNKPNCKHMDASCSSYLPFDIAVIQNLLVDDNYLYVVNNNNASNVAFFGGEGETMKEQPSTIKRMDLDGENQKELVKLKDGEYFGDLFYRQGDQIITTAEKDLDKQNKDITLIRIDASGKRTNIKKLEKAELIGAYENQVLLLKSDFYNSFDASESDESYMNRLRNAQSELVKMSLKDKKETSLITKDLVTLQGATYVEDALYYKSESTIQQIHLKDGKEAVIADNLSHTAGISIIKDQHILYTNWEDVSLNAGMLDSYIIDLKTMKQTKMELETTLPKEYMQILAANKDHYLIIYDYDAKDEYMEHFGVNQVNVNDVRYALIKKEDYWNNNLNIKKITRADHRVSGDA